MNKRGFTLIELVLVMGILAILSTIILGNFNTTLKKGRDAQRKNDFSQIQKALENYYEDNQTYPLFTDIFGKKLCKSEKCLVNGETVYMVKVPNDPSSATYVYVYAPDLSTPGAAHSYYLYSFMENTNDTSQNLSVTGFTTQADCNKSGIGSLCRYYVSSSNAAVLTPNP